MSLWPFRNKGPLQLTEELRDKLISDFGVDSVAADSMRYVTKLGKFARQKVNLVRIFDQARVPGTEPAACTYDNMMDGKERVLFAGHFFSPSYETQGRAIVSLSDLRPS